MTSTDTGALQCPTAALSAFDQLLCSMLRESAAAPGGGTTRDPECAEEGVICVSGTAPQTAPKPKPQPQPKCGEQGFHCQVVGGPGRPTGARDPDARLHRDEARGGRGASKPSKPAKDPEPKLPVMTPEDEAYCQELVEAIGEWKDVARTWWDFSYETQDLGRKRVAQALYEIYMREVDTLRAELKPRGCTFPKSLPRSRRDRQV